MSGRSKQKRRATGKDSGGRSQARAGAGRKKRPPRHSSSQRSATRGATSKGSLARPSAAGRPRFISVASKPWFWPLVVFLVAFVLRVVYTYQVRYTPFFQTLGLDAKFYDRWAKDIAAGSDSTGAFFMTPLYSYFLAVIYRLFGRDLLLVRLIQAGLGSFTAVLTYLVGRDLFDKRTGILAGLIVASYGALIFYDCSILLTPLLVFLNVSAVYLILKADTTARPGHHLAAGALLGLAAIGRAAALLSAAAAILWTCLWPAGSSSRDRGSMGGASGLRRASVRAVVLVVVGIVVVVAPVTVRNYIVSGDFVPITSNGGINFYIGNGDTANGGYVRPEGLDIVTDPDGRGIAEAALGRTLRPSEVSGYWFGRAWAYVRANPGHWAKLMVRKAAFAISSYELPQLENYYFQRRFSDLLRLPLPGFAIVAPLGLLGLGMTFRRRRPRLVGLYVSTYLLSIVLFFVVARYRLPIVPLLAVLASYALFDLIGRARRREYRAMVVPVIAFLALAYVVNANLYRVNRRAGFAQPHYRLGIIYAERGDVDAAIDEFGTSIRFDPSYPKSYLNLGAVLMQNDQTEEARRAFEAAIRLDPGYDVARVNLAMLLEDTEDYDGALAQIDTVLAGDPENARALKERGIVLYKAGRDPEEAEHWLQEALKADKTGEERAETEFYLAILGGAHAPAVPEAAVTAMARADTLAKSGRAVEAADLLREAARLAPTSGEPLRRLALLQRDMGLLDEALANMKKALELDPALDRGHYMYGVFLNEAGRHDDAILEYDAETRINPDFAPAHLNLALTYFFHGGNPNLAAFHYRRYLALGGQPVPELEAVMRDLDAQNRR